MNPQLESAVRLLIRQEMNSQQSPYDVAKVPLHYHNGVDAPVLSYTNISSTPGTFFGGFLNSDGTKGTPFPPKWTSTRSATGDYLITHNLGTLNYSVVAIVFDAFLTPKIVQVKTVSTTSFGYRVGTTSGTGSDANTFFILILPTAV